MVRRNDIHGFFNGVVPGTWGRLEDDRYNNDVDVYLNRIWDIRDDGLEPEGTCINNRFWANTVAHMLMGVSLCPITIGPTWVIRNVFYDYYGQAWKLSNHSAGVVFNYHNTAWTARPGRNAATSGQPWDNHTWRNNIIVATRYVIEDRYQHSRTSFDYDRRSW